MVVPYSFSSDAFQCGEAGSAQEPEKVQGRDQGISVVQELLIAFLSFMLLLYVYLRTRQT